MKLLIFAFASAKSKLFCDSACEHNYAPVCGTNGQTYTNRCLLDCRGATFAHKGVCESAQESGQDDSTTEA
ncbi:unnamed protein product [Leptidea sinapis]|uniref:Kazal-like domain-containing protein n=1 Tax=Leptidea sinapis TaxID=189913 RepID=A0A5E4PMW8_9NEOP|nr:unnamed protein product [Leptidea sinapis]